MKDLLILDNGGETFDRYTVVQRSTGEMIGASEFPFSPQGFGQFCGNVAHNYWVIAYGHGWNRGLENEPKILKARIKEGVKHFENDCKHVGNPIKWEDLPGDVQKFVKQSFE